MPKPVQAMSARELAAELEHIAKIAGVGPIAGFYSRARTAAVMRGAARMLKKLSVSGAGPVARPPITKEQFADLTAAQAETPPRHPGEIVPERDGDKEQ